MPWGLALQSVAMLSWSLILLGFGGTARGVGVFGAISALTILTVLLAFANPPAHVLPVVILAHVSWYAGLALALVRSSGAPTQL